MRCPPSLRAEQRSTTFRRFAARNGRRLVTENWHFTTIYQVQSGMPLTISVFGDTANSGTVLGENPIRANYTGQPIFGPGTHTADKWFNPAAFATPPAFTFGDVGRNSVYGPPLQTLDLALARSFPPRGRAQPPVPRRSLQRTEQSESRHAEPFREHAAVRHHHHGDDPGARTPIERPRIVLGSAPILGGIGAAPLV